jgi:hypothetical protein
MYEKWFDDESPRASSSTGFTTPPSSPTYSRKRRLDEERELNSFPNDDGDELLLRYHFEAQVVQSVVIGDVWAMVELKLLQFQELLPLFKSIFSLSLNVKTLFRRWVLWIPM